MFTPNPALELKWTVDLFVEMIGVQIDMFQYGKAPSSQFYLFTTHCK